MVGEVTGVIPGVVSSLTRKHESNLIEKNIYYYTIKSCHFATDTVIVDLSLVTLELWRPADTKDLNIVLTVRHDCFALFSTWTENCVLKACWEKGLAQEVVDVLRAAQIDERHEWLRRDRRVTPK